ncbi:MAG: replicative DNA helicase [Actinomycetes bacterium]|jgi:replicative DNA helicase
MSDYPDFSDRPEFTERPEPRRAPTRTDSRIPPHNLDAEASLLGAMLLDADPVSLAFEHQLEAGDFYKPAHQHVFASMRTLSAAGDAIDAVTVSEELRRTNHLDELGGLNFLMDLQNATPSISSASRYIRIVRDTSTLRRLIKAASEIADLGYSAPSDIKTVIDEAEQIVFNIGDEQMVDSLQKLHDLTGTVADILEKRFESGTDITGIRTGYRKLDVLLSGMQPGTLNIVGARPAMGKSAFALGMAVNAARTAHRPVLFFSLEMSATELTQRILSAEAQVDSERMRNGQLQDADWTKITNAINRLEIPLLIDDTPQITVMQIRQKLRRVALADGAPAMVVIDYLQLMGGGNNENRQLEIAEISRGLKLLAREFELPVVALSQLSRSIEQRADRRPVLSDLRESGALEQDADVVMFLFREDAANSEVKMNDRGFAEITVAKHRAGPTGDLRLIFNKAYTQFVDEPE